MGQLGYSPYKAPAPAYRTQKARGLKALQDHDFNTPHFRVHGIEEFRNPVDEHGQVALFANPAAFEQLVNQFVRPCPMVPRHGFVDSRPITSVEEAEKIVNETLAVEANAEFIVMPFLDSQYSGIWTDGQLVIGRGTDGATAGTSSRAIPAVGIPFYGKQDHYRWQALLRDATITDAPYMELLWKKRYDYSKFCDYVNYFVQLRNGPKLPASIDYIPAEITVTNVVLAEGDLLEWETKAREFKTGTVVYHPNGSLASHYAVHAVLHNTPVLVSREPKVGEVLAPNTEAAQPKIEQLKAGFYVGATANVDMTTAVRAMLVGCHSTSAWLGKQDILLGVALGCAYRLIITAGLGEFRHQPGRVRKASRNAVYHGVWDKILKPATRTRYLKSLYSFEHDSWRGSYGGRKWLEFSEFAGRIYNAILDENITAALELLNQAVHAAHNSGWAFDKFIDARELDFTAVSPSYTMLKCAPFLYDCILAAEKDANVGLLFFKGRKHYELDEQDEKGAAKDEQLELEEDSEEVDCDCGEHTCENCYSDGCPNGHSCGQCNPDGCGDSDCSECYPEDNPATAADVIQAQVTLKEIGGTTEKAVAHIQYKTAQGKATGKPYTTKDATVTGPELRVLRKIMADGTKVSSMSGGLDTKYVAMHRYNSAQPEIWKAVSQGSDGAYTYIWAVELP